MTRSAFRGVLELENSRDEGFLGQVGFDLDIRNANGRDARNLFNIRVNRLTGLAAIDGTGEIGPQSSGIAEWTLIPRDTAAPLEDTVYMIGGTIWYNQGGTKFSIPLTPAHITVKPDAALYLKYFHQRDAVSDDPHTDPVEPSIPYALAVMVENRGAGVARNLSITSAQPEIVDNEKGLLIDFQIIGTEVAGQNLSPSLNANFGDVLPNERKIGTWLMTSSLQGLFTDYKATFEHLDGLGDPRISLIKEVEIHEMIHMIRALGSQADGRPDFLVNDVADVNDYPDTIHLSDGTTAPVSLVTTGSAPAPTAGALSVTLSAPGMGAGWRYLRIPDPGNGAFRLTSVTRSDGLSIPLDVNVWLTDRTFIGLGRQPIRENILHLTDRDSTGQYTLVYAVIPPPDVTAPSSAVTALPAASGHFIPVAWSGTDNTGIAGYDVYVAVNGGAFSRWIANTRNTAALYSGALGNSYAFYSIARDAAGNEEPAKTQPEATTTVSIENQPPTLAIIPELTVSEGDTLSYGPIADDPDGPEELLRFVIDSPQPGVVIDSRSGRIRWNTGELHGGLSFPVTVTVTDGASEPRSATRQFEVTVLETNSAPQLTFSGNPVLDVGDLLQIQLVASDQDQPVQVVRFRFGSAHPSGMTLDPVTGLLAWVPGDVHEEQVFAVTVEAFDDQTPAGVGQATLRIEVLKKPGLPPEFEESPVLNWQVAGTFTQTFRASDPEGEPVTVTADTSGLPGWALAVTNEDQSVTFHWNTTGVSPGIYELPLMAATARQETRITKSIQVLPRAAYSNYAEWTSAYGLTGVEALPETQLHASVFGNLINYALAIDPRAGISPAQGRPLPHFAFNGQSLSGFRFLMPLNGRPDLRYTVEQNSSPGSGGWGVVAVKDGNAPWTGTWNVFQEPAKGDTRWTTVIPPPAIHRHGLMRLKVETR